MDDKTFEVRGTFLMGDEWKPYTKIIAAPNEKQAQERAFALMGSKHNLKRRYIKIDGVTLVKGE
jgi:large subunit ribosomal protein LX